MENSILNLKEIIENSDKILLISHVNPDGDTLGSCCAMKEFIGEKADILIQVEDNFNLPMSYRFLPSINKAKTFFDLKDRYDLVITLDVASIDRLIDKAKEIFNNAKTRIVIDHHKTNFGFGDINFIRGGISSTGEVLYDLFKELNIDITKNIAICLYSAILTDTGCFKYETTTPHTFEIAKELSLLGINTSEIADLCYTNKPKNLILFQSEVIANSKFVKNDKIAYGLITKELIEKYNAKDDYSEGICETLRSISNVDVAFVLKETKNGTKVSIRTKQIDATKISEVFNGGGHKRAAGCTIKANINQAIEKLLEVTNKLI